MLQRSKRKLAFTLVELLIVIAVLGIITSVVFISTRGSKERALGLREKANRAQAKTYCTINPGFSKISAPNTAGEIKEYRVYCDDQDNMWSETLNVGMNTDYGTDTLDVSNLTGDDQFKWYSLSDNKENILTGPYKTNGTVNDCNEVPAKYLHLFPACNACAGLNYAGFAEGWRLPSQRLAGQGITEDCDAICAKDYIDNDLSYCAPGRQLWDFGIENCGWSPNICTIRSENSCGVEDVDKTIIWDRYAVAGNYWSATQVGTANAWLVVYSHAFVSYLPKTYAFHVRCFLGRWEE